MKRKALLFALISLTSLTACSAGLGKEISAERAIDQASRMASRTKSFAQRGGVVKCSCSNTDIRDGFSHLNSSYNYTLSVNKNLDYHFVKKGKRYYEGYDESTHKYYSKYAKIYLDYTVVNNVEGYDAVGYVKYYNHVEDKDCVFSFAGLDNMPNNDDYYYTYCDDGDPLYGEIANICSYSDICQTVEEYKDRWSLGGTEPFRFYSNSSDSLTIRLDYKNPHIGEENYGGGAGFLASELIQINYRNNLLKSFTHNATRAIYSNNLNKRKGESKNKTTISYTNVGNISLPIDWKSFLINS